MHAFIICRVFMQISTKIKMGKKWANMLVLEFYYSWYPGCLPLSSKKTTIILATHLVQISSLLKAHKVLQYVSSLNIRIGFLSFFMGWVVTGHSCGATVTCCNVSCCMLYYLHRPGLNGTHVRLKPTFFPD